MKTKYLPVKYYRLVKDLPNFHKSGSVAGMKKLYDGVNSLLVKCGNYIYNVTNRPSVYYNCAK